MTELQKTVSQGSVTPRIKRTLIKQLKILSIFFFKSYAVVQTRHLFFPKGKPIDYELQRLQQTPDSSDI